MQSKARQKITPDLFTAFWKASRDQRAFFGLSPEPASDSEVIENRLDLDDVMSRASREEIRNALYDVYNKAHRILMFAAPTDPKVQACFRELAFWNTVRILAGLSAEDMAKSPDHAKRAKHADAVWPAGLLVKKQGEKSFVQARDLLPKPY